MPEPCWSTFELGKAGTFLRLHVESRAVLLPYPALLEAELNEAEDEMRLRFPEKEALVHGERLLPIFHQLQLANVRFLRVGQAEQEGLRIRAITLAKATS